MRDLRANKLVPALSLATFQLTFIPRFPLGTGTSVTAMAIPSWQTQIRLSLIERNRLEQSQSEMIEHTRRLNEQLVVWKERNRTLLAGSTGTIRGERGGGSSKGDREVGGGGAK
jgi:uncharacterized membrane protein YgcG